MRCRCSFVVMLLTASFALSTMGCGNSDEEYDCPAHEDPVCGEDGESYSNSCYAEQADTEVDYYGWCEHDDYPGECDTEWEPVCDVNDRIYTNECFADRYGGDIEHEGECDE